MLTGLTTHANALAVKAMLAPTPTPSPSQTPNSDLDTQGLADWLQAVFGPLFLAIIGIVAIFFLFTREITRFVQFIVLAIAVGVVFYVPGIIEVVAKAIAAALGVET